jgi:hypothetical protein
MSNIDLQYTGDAWRDGESIEYLDLRLRVFNRNGKKWIGTSVFDKPTNLHIYTDPSTWYPMHYVYNWIQGENIRIIRNSSTIESYNDSLKLFKEFLYRRNFLKQKIELQLDLNNYEDRIALLRGEKPHEQRKGKGKGKQINRQDTYILVENSGCREIVTNFVKNIDYLARDYDKLPLHFLPVVKKGKTVLSVMNKMCKDKTVSK